MAGNPPTDLTVEKVLSQPGEAWGSDPQRQTYDEVLFAGDSRTLKVYVPVGTTLSEGETVKGWRNDQKGSVTVAADNAPQNGGGRGSTTSTGGRTDPTGISIERQKSADIAKDLAIATASGDPVKTEANFEHFFDVVYAKVSDKPAAPDAA